MRIRRKMLAAMISATMFVGNLGTMLPQTNLLVPVFADETDNASPVMEPDVETVFSEGKEVEILKETDEATGFVYSEDYDGNITITGYEGTETDLVIPGTLAGKTVTAIGYYAFCDKNTVSSVTLPVSVTKIESYAFCGCTNLVSINLGKVTMICNRAFDRCTSLGSIDLSSVTTIDSFAFQDCSSLTSVSFPAGLTSIGYNAFIGTGITSVTFQNGMTRIPDNACYGMDKLVNLTIPSGVTEIGSSAFYGCTSLTSINLAAIKKIGSNAFQGCTGITKVTYPENIEIGYNAFGDSGVTEVIFASGITKIPDNACYGMTGLTEANIPSTVKSIGNYAYSNCSGITTLNLAGVEEIGNDAFYYCSSLTRVSFPAGLKTVGYSAFSGTGITEVSFASGTTEILPNMCSGMSSLETVTIPSTVTKIGESAFSSCNTLENVTIPDSVKEMGSSVFSNCSGLKTVKLPGSITEIPSSAFSYCTSLESVTFPDSVTSIGSNAFYQCNSLTSIEIKKGVTVDYNAFSYCSNLKKITIGDNAKIGSRAFSYCNSLEELITGKNVELASNAFEGITKSGNVTEDGSMTYTYTFGGKELSIEGSGAMPDFNETDNKAPWSGFAKDIEWISVDNKITYIGAYSFAGLQNVTNLVLPSGLTSIGESAFKGCTGIAYAEMPETLSKLGNNAFAGCSSLKEFYFCGNAPTLGDGCIPGSNTVNVYYPETATGWSKRIRDKFKAWIWKTWDDTIKSKDVVLVLDHSGSMEDTIYYGDDYSNGKPRIEALKDAANAFVDAVVGRTKNTRVAIVKYDDTAEFVSDFTTDAAYLKNQINKLTADGGTNYIPALEKADEILKNGSRADSKNIILFSDGQPFESKEAIQEKADVLDDIYTLYSVGIIQGEINYAAFTDQDEAMIAAVNGNVDHYFRANDIDALIKKFLEIADNITRKPETEVDVKRNGTRFNAVYDDIIFTSDSKETIDIIVTAGTKYGDVAGYALLKNGSSIMSNKDGVFSIKPAELFTSSDYVEVALYDKSGKEVDRKQVKIRIIEGKYKITFMLNDGTETVYATQEISSGEKPTEPDPAPERDGFIFGGWYTSTKCSGYTFFDIVNSPNWPKLDSDTVLYAKWTNASEMNISKDCWGFINSSDEFKSTDYEISYGDYAKLQSNIDNSPSQSTRNLAETYKGWVKGLKNSFWGGSCFGMSSAVVLIKAGKIQLQRFSPKYTRPGKAIHLPENTAGDTDVGNIESMINYYMLEQKVGEISKKAFDYSYNDSYNLKAIIDTMKKDKRPVVLVLFFDLNGMVNGGHAVVGYGLEEDGNTYRFKVYDCSQGNDKEYTVTVTNDGGTYSMECADWENDWNGQGSIKLKSALTADDLEKEILLKEPEIQIYRGASDERRYSLQTSYSSFTVKKSANGTDEQETRIEDGKVSGDNNISIICEGNQSDAKSDVKKFVFYLPSLEDGKAYVITPSYSSGVSSYDTIIADEEGSFLDSVKTNGTAEVNFYNTGYMGTKGSKTETTIKTSGKHDNANWYYVGISGETTGLKVESGKEEVRITAENDTDINITVESDMNGFTFGKKTIGAGETAIIKGKTGNKVVYTAPDGTEDEKDFGYSLTFDSQQGSPVEPLKNQKAGELIDELDIPDEPRKDGFVFTGWYKDPGAKEVWDFTTDTMPEKDTVLYAGWELDPNFFIRVTFRLKNAEDEFTYIPKETTIDKEDDCPVLKGDDTDWYSDAECETKWDFERTVDRNTVLYSAGWQEGRIQDITSVTLNKNSLKMKKGDTEQLSAKAQPEEISTVYVWSSNNEAVATVDNTGKVTAVDYGDAVITVRAGGISASCTVNVSETGGSGQADNRKYVKKENTFVGGQKINLAELYFKGISGIERYKADPKKIASVNKKGILKAKKAGTVKIDALKGKGKDAQTLSSCTIEVLDKPKLKFQKYSIASDEGRVLDAYEFFTTSSTRNTAADAWESKKPEVAEIDEATGEIRINGKGSTTIIAYFGEKGKKETLMVKAKLKVKK